MLILIGATIVLVSVFGGYIAIGGRLVVLFQPLEFLIIAGAALGGFLSAAGPPAHGR
jgi:chemotaxis protein MotA